MASNRLNDVAEDVDRWWHKSMLMASKEFQ